jgi:hypothetical protein
MSLHRVVLAAILFSAPVQAAEAPVPPEIAAARLRYNKTTIATLKPVRDRYAIEIQQIKNRAMTARNLELAVAAENEIKNLAGTPASPETADSDDVSPMPSELAAARARYENAVAVAIKPLRDRYVVELRQMQTRAMNAKNLELAIAADNEIKILTSASASPDAEPSADASSSLLADSRWTTWFGGAGSPEQWIEFRADGKMVRGWAEKDVLDRFTWTMVDATTVRFRVYDAGETIWRFNKRFTEATELDEKGKTKGGRSKRIKVSTRQP